MFSKQFEYGTGTKKSGLEIEILRFRNVIVKGTIGRRET